MSADRELLELAAKAAGLEFSDRHPEPMVVTRKPSGSLLTVKPWNPLAYDGDALRLAVKLHVGIQYGAKGKSVYAGPSGEAPWAEGIGNNEDPFAATRRAIVRAAAEIGRSLP